MNELKLITRFLEEIDPDVSGLASRTLSEEEEASLRRLSEGQGGDELTKQMELLLAENGEAMDFFAGLLLSGDEGSTLQ